MIRKHSEIRKFDSTREYRKALFVLGQLNMLIGNFLLLSFIFPPVNAQGAARDRDIKLGTWLLAAGQLLNLLKESLEPAKRLAGWLHYNSNNPQFNRVLEKPLFVLHAANHTEFDRFYRHLRTASIEVGVMLAFSENLATILTASETNRVVDFVNSSETGYIIARTIIAVAATVGAGSISYDLNTREQKSSQPPLLQSSELSQWPFNKISRLKWSLNIPYTGIYLWVFSSVLLEIINSFAPEFSNRSAIIFTSIFAGTGLLINLIPDRPLANVIYPLQWTGRVLDKYFKVGLLRNWPLVFIFQMNLIAFMAKTPENLLLNNNTVLTIGLLDLWPALHLSEVLFKLASLLNNSPEHRVNPLLKTWDLALTCAVAQYWGLATFAANPIALLLAASTALTAFLLTQHGAREQLSVKQFARQLPQTFNESMCYAGLLLSLCQLTELSLAQRAAFVLPLAVARIGLNTLARRYPVVNNVMLPVEHALLGSGVGSALQQFLKPFAITLPAPFIYIAAAVAGFSSGIYQLRQLPAACKQNAYEPINDRLRSHEAQSISQWRAYVNNLSAATFFIIGIAAFNKATEKLNAEDPLSATGNGLLLIMLGLNLLIMLRILGYNTLQRSDTSEFSQQASADNSSKSFTHFVLTKIGLFKEFLPSSPPSTPKLLGKPRVPDSPSVINRLNLQAI